PVGLRKRKSRVNRRPSIWSNAAPEASFALRPAGAAAMVGGNGGAGAAQERAKREPVAAANGGAPALVWGGWPAFDGRIRLPRARLQAAIRRLPGVYCAVGLAQRVLAH